MSSERKSRKTKTDDFWRACGFLYPYRRLVVIATVCAILTGGIMTSGMTALFPIIHVMISGQSVQSWVAGLIRDHQPNVPVYLKVSAGIVSFLPTNPIATIAVIILALFIFNLIGNVIRFFYEYFSDKIVISAVNDIRRTLYDHVLHMPLSYFGLKGTSDVTSQLVQDCLLLQEGLKIIFGQSLLEVIKIIGAITFAVWIDWRMLIFVIFFSVPIFFVFKKLGKKMRRASRAAMQTNSSMLSQLEGSLIGIRVVKANNAERMERRRYSRIMEGLLHELLKMARYEAIATPAQEMLAMLAVGTVVIFAAFLMFDPRVHNRLTIPNFGALMACLAFLGESSRRLSKVNGVIQRSSAAASRIFETIDVPIERPRSAAVRRTASTSDKPLLNLPLIQRDVRFESVTFSYHNTTAPAVLDVELVVPKGKCVAIVGRNGSGKTTLMAMLPRFYDPDRGRITIDGVDIRNVTLRSLRKQISIVTQDSIIFPGTIAQNIAYGDPRPIEKIQDLIESAAKRAFAHDFIMEKPLGYQTSLDGLGGQLSGGQKQRLNIARAILRQAPILILDEATSQVDAESEHLIQQAIESLMHERTTFVIAHRFSTITSADWIVVMDRGQIVGQGQHDELLKTCETYQNLYERQMVAMPS